MACDAGRWHLHVVHLVGEERLFGLEGFRANLADVGVIWAFVHRLDVGVQGALLRVAGSK